MQTEIFITKIVMISILQPTDALVYDGVYLIANSLDKVYRENSELISNFDGECYQETPRRDWELGAQMFRMFTTVCLFGWFRRVSIFKIVNLRLYRV